MTRTTDDESIARQRAEIERSLDRDHNAVTRTERMFNDDSLRALQTFDDVIAALSGDVVDARTEIGSGFEVLDNKERLLGVPFICVEWSFPMGDYGPFAAVTIVTKSGEKLILNDGSMKSGLGQQLQDYTARTGKRTGLLCNKGLTVSRYTYVNEKGEPSPAATYYIA